MHLADLYIFFLAFIAKATALVDDKIY